MIIKQQLIGGANRFWQADSVESWKYKIPYEIWCKKGVRYYKEGHPPLDIPITIEEGIKALNKVAEQAQMANRFFPKTEISFTTYHNIVECTENNVAANHLFYVGSEHKFRKEHEDWSNEFRVGDTMSVKQITTWKDEIININGPVVVLENNAHTSRSWSSEYFKGNIYVIDQDKSYYGITIKRGNFSRIDLTDNPNYEKISESRIYSGAAVWLKNKNEEDRLIIFDRNAYLMNDNGKTIEKLC